jgi:anti-sigma regulatory factor (Ser/Thr protein kinase)
MMKRRFKRNITSLNEIFEFIENFAGKHNFDHGTLFSLNLVVEELFTNVVKYNSQNKHDVTIALTKRDSDVIITLTEFDTEPFDITKRPEVDIDRHLGERRVGGLGIHLVKKMVDKIDYKYKGRCSKIILTKHLEN